MSKGEFVAPIERKEGSKIAHSFANILQLNTVEDTDGLYSH